MATSLRSYAAAHDTLARLLEALPAAHREASTDDALVARMRCMARALWDHFGMLDGSPRDGASSMSWVGFYAKQHDDTMTLVCREPKPACSPIGLHGMCGRGWKDATTYVVPDIRVLGEHYIACDPKDQSEIVLPVTLHDGTCWGVLDIDSYNIGAFSAHDASELTRMMRDARLMARDAAVRLL